MKRLGIAVLALGSLLVLISVALRRTSADAALAVASDRMVPVQRQTSTRASQREQETSVASLEDPSIDEPPMTMRPNTPEQLTEFLVVDENAATVSDAEVTLSNAGDANPRVQAVTDARGGVELPALVGDRIEVIADGYASHVSVLGEQPWERPFRVVLQRGSIGLRVKVVDDLDAPVRGAKITLTLPATTLRSRSDSSGSASFFSAHGPSGAIDTLVKIEHADVCWPLEGIPVPITYGSDDERTLRAFRWAHIRLECFGPSGEQLEGAIARLTYAPESAGTPASELLAAPGAPQIHVGAAGGVGTQVELKAPPLMDLSLWLRHPSYRSLEIRVEPLNPGEERRIVHRFAESDLQPSLEVRLVDSQQRPLSGRVIVSTATASQAYSLLAAGAARFPLPEYDWKLSASSPGYGTVELHFADGAPPPSPLVVELGAPHPFLEVLVTRADGSAAPGTIVSVYREGEGATQAAETARTDENGIAVFEGLVPGHYRATIGFGWPGQYSLGGDSDLVPYPACALGVRPGERVGLQLVRPSSIAGKATGLKGRSLAWSCIDESSEARTPLFTTSTIPQIDGSFLVTGLPAGRYVAAPAGGSHYSPIFEVDLGVGESLSGVEVDCKE